MYLTNEQIIIFLNLAERTARMAGEYLRKNKADARLITAEGIHDVKVKADRQSERIIVDRLRAQTSFSILSEESGFLEAHENTQLRWIVDPLDGSINYLEGLPICCVSIGLWENDHPLLGVIYDFPNANMYKGIVGKGAWLNDAPIHVRSQRPLSQSILCTGFPVAMDLSDRSFQVFIEQVRAFRKVRLLGSAAMSLSYVASGRVDAYYEKNIKIWDVAAGCAIVKAAGGSVEIMRHVSDHDMVDVYAGTPG